VVAGSAPVRVGNCFAAAQYARAPESGLPQAQVVYADTDLWQRVPETLVDHQLGLVGKPDYVMKTRHGSLIPVEVKTGHTPETPYDSHKLQLMAYGLLIRSNYAQTPEYGLLHYPERISGWTLRPGWKLSWWKRSKISG